MIGSTPSGPFRFQETKELAAGASMPVEKDATAGGAGGWFGWRSMLTAAGVPLYVSPSMRNPFQQLPVLVRKREPLVLSNPFVRLAFDANIGSLVSLRNLKTGREMLAGQEPGPLFRLHTVNYQRNPMFFREDDVLTLAPSLRTFRSARINKHGETEVLTVVHQFTQGITVTVTVSLKADDPVSRWEIAVDNKLPRRPRDAAIVHRVTFPLLGGVKAADADAEQVMALPDCAGRLVREPGKNLAEPVQLEIPGWTSMSWMDLSGPTGGVYVAGHDVRPAVQTILEAKGEAGGKVGLSITRWSVLWPGHSWKPQACSVGLHDSDWHWSADRYREWFYATVTPRATPAWVLAEDGWIMEGMNDRYTCQNLARTLTMGQNNGINYIQSWQAPGHFNIPDIYGWYLANVYGGSEQDFKDAIENVHRRGGHVGFYLNIGDMEANMGALDASTPIHTETAEGGHRHACRRRIR